MPGDMTLDEWLAIERGEDIECYRKEKAFRERIRNEAASVARMERSVMRDQPCL